jgi:hypothetical protein
MLAPRWDFLNDHRDRSIREDEHQHVIVDEDDWKEARRILFSGPTVTLSRRNLLTLLSKLEQPTSKCTIIKADGTHIKVESDVAHYGYRQPGPVNEESEAFIRDLEQLISQRKAP